MGDHSEIQWTDATWNPTTGCTRVSAGCQNCYAFQLHDQRHAAYLAGRMPNAPAQYHRPFSEVQLIPERLSLPLRWTKPRRIFVDSMSDLFHADVPTEFIVNVFAVMAMAPRHTFQVLTKRPRRMQRLLNEPEIQGIVGDEIQRIAWDLRLPDVDNMDPPWPLPNVWLGTSVENQEAAYRIDWLVKTPAAVRFLSCEPLLGPLNLGHWLSHPLTPDDYAYGNLCDETGCMELATYWRVGQEWPAGSRIFECAQHLASGIDWVIVGGESGPDFRPLDLDWARDLRDQCVAAGVPYFFKQIGGRTSKTGGRELDGRTWDEMPQVLQAA